MSFQRNGPKIHKEIVVILFSQRILYLSAIFPPSTGWKMTMLETLDLLKMSVEEFLHNMPKELWKKFLKQLPEKFPNELPI